VNHTCSACNAVSGNKWYVDPVNGNDNTATGSDMAGARRAPGCAFKTIKKLLNAIPAVPFAGTQIIIVGPRERRPASGGGRDVSDHHPDQHDAHHHGGTDHHHGAGGGLSS
jgi:hypothetical protein